MITADSEHDNVRIKMSWEDSLEVSQALMSVHGNYKAMRTVSALIDAVIDAQTMHNEAYHASGACRKYKCPGTDIKHHQQQVDRYHARMGDRHVVHVDE